MSYGHVRDDLLRALGILLRIGVDNVNAKDHSHVMAIGTKTASTQKGIEKVGAYLVRDTENNGDVLLEYAYFAEETQSYWLVSEESLFVLGARDLAYDDWAENDKTAIEYGKRRPAPRG